MGYLERTLLIEGSCSQVLPALYSSLMVGCVTSEILKGGGVASSSAVQLLGGHMAVSSTSNFSVLLGSGRHMLPDEEEGWECVLLQLVPDSGTGPL